VAVWWMMAESCRSHAFRPVRYIIVNSMTTRFGVPAARPSIGHLIILWPHCSDAVAHGMDKVRQVMTWALSAHATLYRLVHCRPFAHPCSVLNMTTHWPHLPNYRHLFLTGHQADQLLTSRTAEWPEAAIRQLEQLLRT
jgi:hypothetical protein